MLAGSNSDCTMRSSASIVLVSALLALSAIQQAHGAERMEDAEISYQSTIAPVLTDYCYGCHGYGASEGGMALDQFETGADAVQSPEAWWKVLRQLRAGLMPPQGEERPSTEQIQLIESWIKSSVFQIDPNNPDPGRVTVRRLNRVEYRNTIRDLLGVDYDTQTNFPADDTGEGFDNIAAVLTISPLLLEKYLEAASEIVAEASNQSFFPRPVPADAAGRREYARELLGPFTTRAFRGPVDDQTLDRLVSLAESVYSEGTSTFENGIAQAMTAVLASPRFLFREEDIEPAADQAHPLVDEYALASRLSYFLWSSMPDDELMRLAGEHTLRDNLTEQVARMLNDRRSTNLIRNFTGQWLLTRDIESVPISAFAVMARERQPDPEADRRRDRFRQLRRVPFEELTAAEISELDEIRRAFSTSFGSVRRFDLDGDLRGAMRRETEMLFEHIVRNDRSLLELIDSDYTFLNERLAQHYEIGGVEGDRMRLVSLPADSQRGGILTQGTVLAVTSNPDRTSPVKRGVFILDNILGIPPAPPPPDIPSLEDSETDEDGRKLSLRETLALHRGSPLCSSCPNRMDPLGLALENFNALGRWREQEHSQEIDVAGTLITGESFSDAQELKQILATQHSRQIYRCLTEKLLIYALGRGLDYQDVYAVDEIVQRIEASDGRASALLMGIIESAPFQRARATPE